MRFKVSFYFYGGKELNETGGLQFGPATPPVKSTELDPRSLRRDRFGQEVDWYTCLRRSSHTCSQRPLSLPGFVALYRSQPSRNSIQAHPSVAGPQQPLPCHNHILAGSTLSRMRPLAI